MNVDKQLEQLEEKTSKSKEELEDELQDTLDEVKEKNSSIPDEKAKKIAFNRFKASWRKRLNSSGDMFKVMVIGFGDRVNYNRKKYDKAIEMYEEDPETAIEKGIVKEDEEGNPVPLHYVADNRRDQASDYELEQEGDELPEYNWGRTIHAAVYDEEADTWRAAEISAQDDDSKVVPPTFKKCEVELYKADNSTADMWNMYSSGDFNFKVQEEPNDAEVREIIDEAFPPEKKFELSDIESFDNRTGDYEMGIVKQAQVMDISSQKTNSGNRRVAMQDDSLELFTEDGEVQEPVNAWFPERIDINFPEHAEIIVVGTTNVYEDDDGNKRKNLNVLGAFTPPHFRNEMPDTEEIESDQDADW